MCWRFQTQLIVRSFNNAFAALLFRNQCCAHVQFISRSIMTPLPRQCGPYVKERRRENNCAVCKYLKRSSIKYCLIYLYKQIIKRRQQRQNSQLCVSNYTAARYVGAYNNASEFDEFGVGKFYTLRFVLTLGYTWISSLKGIH